MPADELREMQHTPCRYERTSAPASAQSTTKSTRTDVSYSEAAHRLSHLAAAAPSTCAESLLSPRCCWHCPPVERHFPCHSSGWFGSRFQPLDRATALPFRYCLDLLWKEYFLYVPRLFSIEIFAIASHVAASNRCPSGTGQQLSTLQLCRSGCVPEFSYAPVFDRSRFAYLASITTSTLG